MKASALVAASSAEVASTIDAILRASAAGCSFIA
jgi:hypothetical protein